MDQPVSRRAWLASLAGGAGLVATACQGSAATEVHTPDQGRVLRLETDTMLVLVSGLAASYVAGETIQLNLLVNNQGTQPATVKLRSKVLGLGDQAVIQAEPVLLEVSAENAAQIDQPLPIPRDLPPGDYTLAVEVPPWIVNGRPTGSGGTLRGAVRIDRSG